MHVLSVLGDGLRGWCSAAHFITNERETHAVIEMDDASSLTSAGKKPQRKPSKLGKKHQHQTLLLAGYKSNTNKHKRKEKIILSCNEKRGGEPRRKV